MFIFMSLSRSWTIRIRCHLWPLRGDCVRERVKGTIGQFRIDETSWKINELQELYSVLMNYIEQFGLYSLITLFSLPILAVFGFPLLLAAAGLWRMTRNVSPTFKRILIVAIPVALGIAPVYAHTSAIPLYICLLTSAVTPVYGFISFSVTWAIVVCIWQVIFKLKDKSN